MPLHPDAQKVVDMIVESGRPPYESVGHKQARELYMAARRILQSDPPPVAEIKDLTCEGPAGPIPLRLYRGQGTSGATPQPTLIYFHGGGWVIGSIDSHEGVCRELANRAQCTVVSVEYRLAPEHKFPGCVEDCLAAARWVSERADTLGVDRSRLAVGGDSAGGNLAAVAALDARDRGVPRYKFQLLIYPATDMGMGHPSVAKHAEQLPLTRKTMAWFVDLYLRGKADVTDWRASPLKAKDLKGLPPAYVLTAGMDPLCDEGEAYAAALKAAGVAVTAKRYEGQIHGFITMGRIISDSAVALGEMGSALKTALRS